MLVIPIGFSLCLGFVPLVGYVCVLCLLFYFGFIVGLEGRIFVCAVGEGLSGAGGGSFPQTPGRVPKKQNGRIRRGVLQNDPGKVQKNCVRIVL